jgi:hypothetical protein
MLLSARRGPPSDRQERTPFGIGALGRQRAPGNAPTGLVCCLHRGHWSPDECRSGIGHKSASSGRPFGACPPATTHDGLSTNTPPLPPGCRRLARTAPGTARTPGRGPLSARALQVIRLRPCWPAPRPIPISTAWRGQRRSPLPAIATPRCRRLSATKASAGSRGPLRRPRLGSLTMTGGSSLPFRA